MVSQSIREQIVGHLAKFADPPKLQSTKSCTVSQLGLLPSGRVSTVLTARPNSPADGIYLMEPAGAEIGMLRIPSIRPFAHDGAAAQKAVKRLYTIGFGLCFANFAGFCIGSALLGGDALNGFVKDGHYFLGSHGKFTEVSSGIYGYSKLHAATLFFSHPLGMFCIWAASKVASDTK